MEHVVIFISLVKSHILVGNNSKKNENYGGKGAGVDGRKGLQVEKNSLLGLRLDSSRNIPHSFGRVRNKLKVRLVLRRFIIRVFSFFLIYTRENEIPCVKVMSNVRLGHILMSNTLDSHAHFL